jgi:hypothetical protein
LIGFINRSFSCLGLSDCAGGGRASFFWTH